MSEEWRWAVGYEGKYEVSNTGNVRTWLYPGIQVGKKRQTPRVLARYFDQRGGYPFVSFRRDGKSRPAKVHVLVAAAFISPRPLGLDIRHLNGDVTDCRVENLRYGTRAENIQDAVRHGTHAMTRKTHCKQGHPFAGDNLFVNPAGARVCLTCRRASISRCDARRRARRKTAATADPSP